MKPALLLLACAASAATLEWQPIPGAEYHVHWADNANVVPGAAVVVSTGTAASAWIPNPPRGKVRFAVVTAHYPSEPMPLLYASRSMEVSWPLIAFTFAVMTSNDLSNWKLATNAVVALGTDNRITVSIPATGTANFIHLRYVAP